MRIPDRAPDIYQARTKAGFQEALSDPRYWDLARRIDRKYHHWDKVRFIARDEGLDAEMLWMMVKFTRQGQYKEIALQGESEQSLKYTVPDSVQQELMLIDQQLAGRLVAPDDQPLSPSHQERYIISALREEAIASSMLEGAVTTRQDAKHMLRTGRKPRTRGERMVLNNYKAMNFIRDHRTTPLTPEFILKVQEILTKDTLDDPSQSGRFRTSGDDIWIGDDYGEVVHVPPDAGQLSARLKRLCSFANQRAQQSAFMHPVVRASILHFQIGFDHPFCDGNGRTARALFYWSMLRDGYWLFEYLPISVLIYKSPSQYYRAFLYCETDDFDITYFLVYKTRIVSRARELLGEYISKKQKDMASARKFFSSDARLNHRQRELINRFVRSPYVEITIQEHQGNHGIAYGTARSDLLDLAEWGYVNKISSGGRKFSFVRGARIDEAGC